MKLFPGFGVVLRKVCEDEPHLIPFEKYNTCLRLVLPIIDVIVSNLTAVEALQSLKCGECLIHQFETLGDLVLVCDYRALINLSHF